MGREREDGDQIAEQFLMLGVTLDEHALRYAEEACADRGLSGEDLAEAWLAYTITKGLTQQSPTPDLMHQMLVAQDQHRHQAKALHTTQPTVMVHHHEYEDDVVMSDYLTTPKNERDGRGLSTPNNRPNGTPLSSLRPATYSSSKNKSAKFSTRVNSGEVLAEYGDDPASAIWTNTFGNSCTVSILPNADGAILSQKAMYGFELLQDKARILDRSIEYMAEVILENAKIKETMSVKAKAQTPGVVVGRIDCDSNGRLNPKSVVLQSTWKESFGHYVPVDLDLLKNYSLFPGQIVAMRGLNPRGDKFVVQEILSDGVYPENVSQINAAYSFEGSLHAIVASGPFTTSDSLDYEPLTELISYIVKHKPHTVILIGPFMDSNHDLIQEDTIAESYKSYFEKLVDRIMNAIDTSSGHTQIVMVSSPKDIFTAGIYPSPPFALKKTYKNLILAPDPCILNIEGVLFGVTSSDILMHLSREEITLPLQGPDKMARLCTYLFNQRSFYPLWPPNVELSVDMELWSEYAHMTTMPHLLILPSDLQYFVKEVSSCLTINPGRLTKGIGGGTFSRLQITKNSTSTNITCQVLRI